MENKIKTIAIITGAAGGLGKEFVKQINIDHVDEIWAIDIDKTGLQDLPTEVLTPIKALDLDLSKPESFEQLEKLISQEKPNIKWLINNAGFAKAGSFEEISKSDATEMVDVNAKAYVALTNMCLKHMQPYAKIINVASVASYVPLPYLSVFCATQAFILSYSRALKYELKRKNISITCVCPHWTKTKFIDNLKTTKHEIISYYSCVYDKTLVVKQALKDAIKKKQLSIYGKRGKFLSFLSKFLPYTLFVRIWQKQQKLFEKYPPIKK